MLGQVTQLNFNQDKFWNPSDFNKTLADGKTTYILNFVSLL